MPKRNNQDRIERYQQKIRKLEHQEQRKYKRIIYSSSEDSDDNSDNPHRNDPDQEPIGLIDQNEDGMNDVLPEEEIKPDGEQEPTPVPELDPHILSALGETTEETPRFGPKIHENLSRLWLPILRKGLSKETKEKLTKEYLIPENCPLLQAPKLNPEISAAVNEGTRARDKRVEGVQQQLGRGIAALNKGLDVLLDDSKDKVQAIKFLSDSCRLLCDLHFEETEARKKFVTPGLDKSFLNIMQDIDRDEMLFGSKLSDKIKATKVIEKHGLQIKKPAPNPKTPSTAYQPTNRSHSQGNWGGPPRFSSNKGGRGGPKRTVPTARKVHTSAAQQKSSIQSKQRAASRQQ